MDIKTRRQAIWEDYDPNRKKKIALVLTVMFFFALAAFITSIIMITSEDGSITGFASLSTEEDVFETVSSTDDSGESASANIIDADEDLISADGEVYVGGIGLGGDTDEDYGSSSEIESSSQNSKPLPEYSYVAPDTKVTVTGSVGGSSGKRGGSSNAVGSDEEITLSTNAAQPFDDSSVNSSDDFSSDSSTDSSSDPSEEPSDSASTNPLDTTSEEPKENPSDNSPEPPVELSILAYSPPQQNENYISGEGTDLSSYNSTTLQNISGYVWHSQNNGKIEWSGTLNLSNESVGGDNNLDNDIEFGAGFVSIDSFTANAFAGQPATITIENMQCGNCNANDIVYSVGYYQTIGDIRLDSQSCSLSGKCSSFSCTNPGGSGNCSFDVTGFTGYAVGGNADLTIYDSAEGSSALVGENVTYFAEYNDTGSLITGASCNITDDLGTFVMIEGSTSYEYNRTGGYSTEDTHTWSVKCSASGYTTLNAGDDITIDGFITGSTIQKAPGINGAQINKIRTGTLNETDPENHSAESGRVDELHLSSFASTVKWQGYFGRVAATLRLGLGDDILFSFGQVPTEQIKSIFASTDSEFNFANFSVGTAAQVDAVYDWSVTDADSGTRTLDDGNATISQITGVPVANLRAFDQTGIYNDTLYQSGVFRDNGTIAPGSYDTLAYGSQVVPDQYAFDNVTVTDYQIIVPVNSSGRGTTQTFWFFMDIE